MNDRTRQHHADTAADHAARIALGLTALLTRIRSHQQGRPGAQSYDTARSGPRSVSYCEVHERDLKVCEKARADAVDAGREPGPICTGRTLTIVDPVAETAIEYDPARADERELDRAIGQMLRAQRRIFDIAARYRTHRPTPKDKRDTEDADPGCSSCARLWVAKGVRRWEPVYVEDAKAVGHPDRPLCSWCYRFARDNGELPTEMQLADHHDGKRVQLTRAQQTRRLEATPNAAGTHHVAEVARHDGVDIAERLNPGHQRKDGS